MQVSILIIGTDEVLSHSGALLLNHWYPVVVGPDAALGAMAANAWDLLILCQTIEDGLAADLAQQMKTLHPDAKVMAVTLAADRLALNGSVHAVTSGWRGEF